MSLIDKIRAARQSTIMVDGHAYTIRRPTDAEAMTLGAASGLDLVNRYVIGWDHTEITLGIPGAGPEPVQFNPELWADWVADQPQLWSPISAAIITAYTQHRQSREDAAKN